MGTERIFEERDNGITEPYKGRLGQTSFEPVLWTDPAGNIVSVRVYTTVNATTDPVLADRLCAGTLNWVRWGRDEQLYPVRVPVIYHDEDRRLFVLVLPEDYRCRELEERANLLSRLAADRGNSVPGYVLDFAVVYGSEGLSRLVQRDAVQVEVTPVRSVPADLFAQASQEQEEAAESLEARAVLQAEADAVLRDMEEEVAGWPAGHEAPRTEETVVQPTLPTVGRDLLDEEPLDEERQGVATEDAEAPHEALGDERSPGPETEPSAQPAPTGRHRIELPGDLAELADVTDRKLLLREGRVVAAARLEEEAIVPFFGRDARLFLQLHRTDHGPLVTLWALSDEAGSGRVSWVLDVLSEGDLDVLEALSADFRVRLELYDQDLRLRYSHEGHYPLEENTKAVRRMAMEELTKLGDEKPDLEEARRTWKADESSHVPSQDHGFTARSFEKLETPQQAATALGILDWWLEPEREERLLYESSFPVVWWRRIKQRVMRAILEYGLWPSERLVEQLLAEGYATSRKDLVRHMMDKFIETVRSSSNDLDLPQEHENWNLLLEAARQAGVVVPPEAEELAAETAKRMDTAKMAAAAAETAGEPDSIPLDESDLEEVSGDSEEEGPHRPSLRDLDTEELLEHLSSKDTRVRAALVLCERRDPETVDALFDSVQKMTRSEVLQVLPLLVSFGAAAEPHFVRLLTSNKSFLRQGAALALGILRSSTALDALVDCLLSEPTGIWKEVARVLGEIGPGILVTLASRVPEANAEGRERIAYALAHLLVATRDTDLLRDYADGSGAMAAVAERAYALREEAQRAEEQFERDDAEDESVVTAFTRQFLQALREGEELTDEDILEEDTDA